MPAGATTHRIVRRGMAVAAYTAVLIALGAALLTRGSDGAPPPTPQVGVPRHHARAVIKKPAKPRPPGRHHPHRAIVPPPPPVALHIDHKGAGHGTVAVLGGARCTGDCTIGITRGRVLTLTAETVTGSRFAGWAAPAACRGSTSCDVQVRAEMTVAARFTALPRRPARTITAHARRTVVLTTALSGHARLDVRGRGACEHGCTYRRGARATLRVTHRADARVTWIGARCDGDTCTVRMTRNRTVMAAISDPPPVQTWRAPEHDQEPALEPAATETVPPTVTPPPGG